MCAGFAWESISWPYPKTHKFIDFFPGNKHQAVWTISVEPFLHKLVHRILDALFSGHDLDGAVAVPWNTGQEFWSLPDHKAKKC